MEIFLEHTWLFSELFTLLLFTLVRSCFITQTTFIEGPKSLLTHVHNSRRHKSLENFPTYENSQGKEWFFEKFHPKLRFWVRKVTGSNLTTRLFLCEIFWNFVVKNSNLAKCGNVYKLIYSKMYLSGGGCSFWRIKYFGKIFKIRQIAIISVL